MYRYVSFAAVLAAGFCFTSTSLVRAADKPVEKLPPPAAKKNGEKPEAKPESAAAKAPVADKREEKRADKPSPKHEEVKREEQRFAKPGEDKTARIRESHVRLDPQQELIELRKEVQELRAQLARYRQQGDRPFDPRRPEWGGRGFGGPQAKRPPGPPDFDGRPLAQADRRPESLARPQGARGSAPEAKGETRKPDGQRRPAPREADHPHRHNGERAMEQGRHAPRELASRRHGDRPEGDRHQSPHQMHREGPPHAHPDLWSRLQHFRDRIADRGMTQDHKKQGRHSANRKGSPHGHGKFAQRGSGKHREFAKGRRHRGHGANQQHGFSERHAGHQAGRHRQGRSHADAADGRPHGHHHHRHFAASRGEAGRQRHARHGGRQGGYAKFGKHHRAGKYSAKSRRHGSQPGLHDGRYGRGETWRHTRGPGPGSRGSHFRAGRGRTEREWSREFRGPRFEFHGHGRESRDFRGERRDRDED